MNQELFKDIKKVHCVGIGGIGVSALARFMLHAGKEVTGSDRSVTDLITKLEEEGVKFLGDHLAGNITDDIDLVVYSPAITTENPELATAKAKGIKMLSYPEVLGEISKVMFTITVSGTHGKTTTTSMIADVLTEAGLSPTVIVGSIMKKFGSNFVAGKGSIFVVEACEYRDSFLSLHPDIAVITNIEEDHLDWFKDKQGVLDAFKKFVARVKDGGTIVVNLCKEEEGKVVAEALYRIEDYSLVTIPEEVQLMGNHNYENAKAVLVVASLLSVPLETAYKALNNFQGTWRRIEEKGESAEGALLYDDYAHHPTEIRATLSALKGRFPDKKIVAIFQPHLYSRTKLLLNDFGKAFGDASQVFVLPIYAAREEDDGSISSADVVKKIAAENIPVELCENFDQCVEKIKAETSDENIVVTLGAGDVYHLHQMLS